MSQSEDHVYLLTYGERCEGESTLGVYATVEKALEEKQKFLIPHGYNNCTVLVTNTENLMKWESPDHVDFIKITKRMIVR